MRHWRKLNTDYWGTRLFGAGLVLMCSPWITVLFAEPITILLIMYVGAVMTVFGMVLTLSWRK
jgi:hypothetical protein